MQDLFPRLAHNIFNVGNYLLQEAVANGSAEVLLELHHPLTSVLHLLFFMTPERERLRVTSEPPSDEFSSSRPACFLRYRVEQAKLALPLLEGLLPSMKSQLERVDIAATCLDTTSTTLSAQKGEDSISA